MGTGKFSTTVEFHAFEIHTLNDDMRLQVKSISFFPRFHEIDILNAVRADSDDAQKRTLSRLFCSRMTT